VEARARETPTASELFPNRNTTFVFRRIHSSLSAVAPLRAAWKRI
jgi:hypothetical protein